jgi:hypothetical protein
MIPDTPSDTFFRWDYYESHNYEEIREMVNVLYAEKPDLEFAINCFGQFNTEKEALAYKDAHLEELMTDLHIIQNGAWSLMGDFKENRKRMDFYNKNTQILKSIMDQNVEDAKLGKELMRKRITRDKTKNVEQCGPDAAGLKTYANELGSIKTKGGKQVLNDDDRRKIAADCGYDVDTDGNFVKREESVDPNATPEELIANGNAVVMKANERTADKLAESAANTPGVAAEGMAAASSMPFVPPAAEDPDDCIDDGTNLIVPVYTTDGESFKRTAFLTKSSAPDDKSMPSITHR